MCRCCVEFVAEGGQAAAEVDYCCRLTNPGGRFVCWSCAHWCRNQPECYVLCNSDINAHEPLYTFLTPLLIPAVDLGHSFYWFLVIISDVWLRTSFSFRCILTFVYLHLLRCTLTFNSANVWLVSFCIVGPQDYIRTQLRADSNDVP